MTQIKNYSHITLIDYLDQLGTFFVIGERAGSPFVAKSGHADNPATFAPCVKSMTADFISAKLTMFPTEGLPHNFLRQIFVT